MAPRDADALTERWAQRDSQPDGDLRARDEHGSANLNVAA